MQPSVCQLNPCHTVVCVDDWEVTPELVEDLVQVFCGWSGLPRAHKQSLLRAWRVEIIGHVEGARKRRRFEIERIRVGGLPAHVWLYKKMKRLGVG